MPNSRFQRSKLLGLVTVGATLALVATSCGRSGSSAPSGASSGSASAKPSASSTAAAAGQFGTLKKVCAPGPATGASGRGIVGKTIHLGVLGDPGAAAAPGLEQEFFDAADAFSKWCNAAGGINGYQLVVDHLDAKLFNGGQQVVQACQKDFMLVGGGNALDASDVKPRLGCKLGQIPAYTVSPEATGAGLQVTPVASVPTTYTVAPLRLLAEAFPDTKQGLGIAGSNLASLAPQGLRAQEAYQKLGFKVTTVQPRPALVDNYRPWMEQLKQSGAKADFEVTAQDPSPIFTGMNDTGFKPQWVLFGQTFYSSKSVQAAKAAKYLPNSFIDLSNLPFELAGKFPVVQQVIDIMKAGTSSSNYDSFTDLAFNSWSLWAQSATACGSTLTQDCILQKAGAHPNWDAGGLFAPVNTSPSVKVPSSCVVMMRLTTDGFVYDQKVTNPNNGVYNCGPQNLATVKSYLS
ncbi:MAG TPA: ABC transporter substrate-binding protein [Frankiaceae bacterium]|nr:ABC transporter substrate-binding protein [Frankiaceae bacterium]